MLLASSRDVFVVVVACAMMSSVMMHDVCIYIYICILYSWFNLSIDPHMTTSQ